MIVKIELYGLKEDKVAEFFRAYYKICSTIRDDCYLYSTSQLNGKKTTELLFNDGDNIMISQNIDNTPYILAFYAEDQTNYDITQYVSNISIYNTKSTRWICLFKHINLKNNNE